MHSTVWDGPPLVRSSRRGVCYRLCRTASGRGTPAVHRKAGMPTHVRRASLLALPLALLLVRAVATQAPLREAHAEDDFTVREEMVPMRDGVKLYTVILAPKTSGPLPILLQRTPYDVTRQFSFGTSRLAVAMGHSMLDGGY